MVIHYTAEGILPLCQLQQREYCHCLSVREGILALYGLQQRGYCIVGLLEGMLNSVGYSRGDTATLWVIVEGMLPLSGLQHTDRGDTATF